jgi:putative oxidoreductase
VSDESHPRLVIPALQPAYDALADVAFLALRVAAGAFLVPHGYGKMFGGLERTAGFFDSIGYQPGMLWAILVAAVEFGGGILLALGLLTRPVAIAIAIFMLNAVAFHWPNGFFWTDRGWEYPAMWAVVALFFAVRGGGRFSVDDKLGRAF